MNTGSNYRTTAGERTALAAYQRTLDGWPVPAEQRALPTRHGETFVVSWGEAARPPLLLLHGSAANSSTWAGEAAVYGSTFRVHAVDLPGETGKSTTNRPLYEGTTYADWLADVLDGLDLERVPLVGLSLGGWVALKFAAAFPERTGRLVLIAPGGIVPARRRFVCRSAVYQRLGRWGLNRIAREVFGPQTAPPGVAEGFAFMLRHYRARRDNLPCLSDAELERVSGPTFLIGGEEDALLDMPGSAARLGRRLPHFQAKLLPATGHAVLGSAPLALRFLAADATTPGPLPVPAS